MADSHTPEAIRQRLLRAPRQSYLKDFTYGSVDGLVTTFAIVSGVAGAGLSSGVIIVLGLANLLADGFSMAAANFLGTRAELQERERMRAEELRHISLVPEGEAEEIRQIFARKGFSGEPLEHIVHVITGDKLLWVNTMLHEELGLSPIAVNPRGAALATFAAFVLLGSVPLLAFLWNAFGLPRIPEPFTVSIVMTALAFFAIGAFKSQYAGRSGWRSGTETLAIGGAAALLAYGVGLGLKGLTGAG